MTTRDPDGTVKRLHLDQADVSVRILGDLAETAFELCFRNDGDRPVEGEFVLPLPEGATVSGYALEVNGKMRDSVAVEKDRARTAYESIKRRMVDPGLVEREANNTYRTKVFPVPAKGTKRLRISYTEALRETAAGTFAYALPLDFPEAMDHFSCKISGIASCPLTITHPAALEFTADNTGEQSANLKDSKPVGTLALMVKLPAEPLLIAEDDPPKMYYLTAIIPQLPSASRPAPASIALVWDASLSALTRDHDKELSLLDSWFAKLGKTHIHLHLLRDRIEDGGEFDVRDGQWDKLKQTLRQVDYDGATCFYALPAAAKSADLIVYVGDGVPALGDVNFSAALPWVILHSGGPLADNRLARLAGPTGSTVIDLTKETIGTALEKLSEQPMSFSIDGAARDRLILSDNLCPGHRLRVLGTLQLGRSNPPLQLTFTRGSADKSSRIAKESDAHPNGLIRRIHAQQVLADLERQTFPDRYRIISHCKSNGLVSAYTSLIVLDRIEDYARYQIPPPEPELQVDYERLVYSYDRYNGTGVGAAWSAKLQWYRHPFPDYDGVLRPRLKQVGIWKKAVELLFAPEQRDPVAFATIAGWHDKAVALIAERPKLKTMDDYQQWKESIDEMNDQGKQLAQTPLHQPPAGKPLTVAVRGMVVNPGLVTGTPGMTLRQAIRQPDSPQPLANLDYVALYRNAGKTIYNMLSEQYQDIPLFPADMVVVGQPPESGGCCDPFAAAQSADPFAAAQPADPAKRAAVIQQQDLWIPARSDNSDLFAAAGGDSNPSGSGDSARGENGYAISNITVRPAGEGALIDTAAMKEFSKAVAAGADAPAAYRKLLGGKIYQPQCYVEIARVLFGKGHDALATRALSNLLEQRPGDVGALRSYAYWLAEFGQSGAAEQVLSPLSFDNPLIAMDLASIQATRRDLAGAANILSGSMIRDLAGEPGELAAIALTKYNVLYRFLSDPMLPYWRKFPEVLTADIRVCVTLSSADDSLRLEVIEPDDSTCCKPGLPSQFGGRITGANGVREYMIRHAVPGTYQIRCSAAQTTTVRAVIHTHWGGKNQQTKVVTQWLEPQKLQQLGEIQFEFEPMDNR